MTIISGEEVRIPRRAREAVARHERVVVTNRERLVFVILHPDDVDAQMRPARRGRPLRDALAFLADGPGPDESFAEDMAAVMDAVGPSPEDSWARS
jgi:hypothetical protein